MRDFKAFTLAEVLIAMTIIGIIAVLTVPNLLTDSTSKANNTKFKTTFAQIQQGLITAANVRKNEFVKVGENAANKDKTIEQLDAYMNKHFSVSTSNRNGIDDEIKDAIANGRVYKLKNGSQLIFTSASIITMQSYGCSNSHSCTAYIDINGQQGPNEVVQCTSGTTSITDITSECTVSDDIVSDIFPIVIKNSHIYPGSNAVNYVLSK